MYAQLGNIRFEGLKGFTSLEETFGVNYAQHERINGKPRLQAVGDVLDTLSFSMYLHKEFTDPEADIEALRIAMIDRQILPLVLGNGRVVGSFVIPSFSKTTLFTDKLGNIIEATIAVELLEAFTEDLLLQSFQQAKIQAFATVERNSNVRTVLPPKLSPGMVVTAEVSKIQASSVVISQHSAQAVQYPERAELLSEKINDSLTTIEESITTVNQALSQSVAMYNLATNLPNALDNVFTRVQNFRAIFPISNVADLLSFSGQLNSAVLLAKTANMGLSNQSIIRRI